MRISDWSSDVCSSDLAENAPVPGNDVVLNLDVNVQAVAEQALQEALSRAAERPPSRADLPNVATVGSTVVLDPHTGAVMAMDSAPSFAPSEFVAGLSTSQGDLRKGKHRVGEAGVSQCR